MAPKLARRAKLAKKTGNSTQSSVPKKSTALQILADGKIYGKPLTKKQELFFREVAEGLRE